MPDIHECLTAWRRAERLRDAMPQDSPDWEGAQQEVRQARLVYEATLARATARYRVAADAPQATWWPTLRPIRSHPAR